MLLVILIMQVLSFFLFFLFLFLLIKSWFLKFWKNEFFRVSFHPEAIVFNEFCTSPVGVPAFWEFSFHSWLSVKLKRQMAQSVLQSQQCVSLKLCSDGSTHVKSPAQDTDPCVGSWRKLHPHRRDPPFLLWKETVLQAFACRSSSSSKDLFSSCSTPQSS